MKKSFLTIFSFVILVSNTLSQTPTETPKVDDDEVVVINTRLIQIDVTVTDKDGKIVKDLKLEDFEVFENKDKQDITNFSFVQNIRNAPILQTPETNSIGNIKIPIPPTKIRAETVKRTIALVVDDLTLSFESIYQVRRALKKFLDEQMQEGDLVAIIRTGGGIGALQQFTYDKQQLYAAVEKVKWNPAGTGGIGAFAPIESSAADLQKNANPNLSDEDYQAAKNREREFQQNRDSYFVAGTLGALNFVIKGMKELPGRKSVMLLSDGFSLTQTDRSGFKELTAIADSLKNLIEVANRSSVVIYSIDARGLQTAGLTAADSTSGLTQDQVSQQLSDRRETLSETQDTLRYLAKETGGLAVVNSNDIGGGIKKMIDDQSGYYLIGYQPDDSTFDAATRKFNKLTVRVKRPGLRVRYRSGFFGVADDTVKKPLTVVQTASNQMLAAISSPFQKNEIVLNLNTLFGNSQKQGSFIRSFLHINAKDLKFTEQTNGGQQATFDVLGITFGDNGVPVDQFSKNFTLTINKQSYLNLLEKGFVYNFVLPIKTPGAYQMRVVLRDAGTAKIGSASQFIEVPNLKKNRLTLSSLVLENFTMEDWNSLSKTTKTQIASDPMGDTSLRKFRQNTVLRYGFEIYNSKILNSSSKPNLQLQIRIFRDGKIVLDGKPSDIDFSNQTDLSKISSGGAIALGKTMDKGDYVLQIIVVDKNAKQNRQIATQWVSFEIF
jgi:VWFA-related protein